MEYSVKPFLYFNNESSKVKPPISLSLLKEITGNKCFQQRTMKEIFISVIKGTHENVIFFNK